MTRLVRSLAVYGLVLAAFAGNNAWADTTCRARDTFAIQGQILCIPTPEGPRLARCDTVVNVTSWTFLEAPCPRSLSRPDPESGGEEPAPSQAPTSAGD